jgi:glyoxylase-like metal-dependent hydrolase (beta-lactamase superfamily II)
MNQVMAVTVRAFFHEATFTVSYLVSDLEAGEAAIIDPVLDFDPASGRIGTAPVDAMLSAAAEAGCSIRWILETHAHADHLSGAQRARTATGAPVVIGARITEVQAIFAPRFMATDVASDGGDFDRLVSDGDQLPLGRSLIRVMATPGHTPACVSYLIDDCAFTGDTLFLPDYGTARTDFPGGDAACLYRSIRRILALPETTRIFVGHDYKAPGRDAFAWESSVAAQKRSNVQIHDGVSEDAFVASRNKRDRDLAPPRLLLPSLQVNIRGGRLPPADADGVSRLRIPLVTA